MIKRSALNIMKISRLSEVVENFHRLVNVVISSIYVLITFLYVYKNFMVISVSMEAFENGLLSRTWRMQYPKRGRST